MAGSGQDWEVHQARSCEQEQRRREHVLLPRAIPIVTSLPLSVPSTSGTRDVYESTLG